MSQITSIILAGGPGSGTVTSISAGIGITLTPNPITTTGTVSLSVPVSIANGGTNAITFANTNGTVYFNGTRLVNTVPGTAGFVLTSNGAAAPTFQAISASGAVTSVNAGENISITGTATAPIVNIAGTTNHAVQIGNATGSLTSIPVGLTGQVLTGVTGGDPVFAAPSGGVTSVTGTANQITASPTTGAVILTTPATFIAPGSIAATTTVTATLGNITITSGNLVLTAATTATVGQIVQAGTRILHTFGTQNTFLGSGAGNFTLTGNTNVGIGTIALTSVTSGSNNVSIGTQCTTNINTGSRNCFGGFQSGVTMTSGSDNTGWGYDCLASVATGLRNTVLGRNAGQNHTLADSDNICIGYTASGAVGQSNNLVIGTGTGTGVGQLNKAFISGIFGITVGVSGIPVLVDNANQLGTIASSKRYKENIFDMSIISDDIYKLRPVVFNYKKDEHKSMYYGLIAEEVQKVMPNIVVKNKDEQPETVKYLDLIPLLLNELQKVKIEIDILKRR